MIQLRGLGPLGFIPELLNTQQIEQTLRSDSCALVYRLGTGLFWFILNCDLFLMYILLCWQVVVSQALCLSFYSLNISTIKYYLLVLISTDYAFPSLIHQYYWLLTPGIQGYPYFLHVSNFPIPRLPILSPNIIHIFVGVKTRVWRISCCTR